MHGKKMMIERQRQLEREITMEKCVEVREREKDMQRKRMTKEW